jgi:hypothetical protein
MSYKLQEYTNYTREIKGEWECNCHGRYVLVSFFFNLQLKEEVIILHQKHHVDRTQNEFGFYQHQKHQ